MANAWDNLTGSLILSQVFHSVGGWEVKVMHSWVGPRWLEGGLARGEPSAQPAAGLGQVISF